MIYLNITDLLEILYIPDSESYFFDIMPYIQHQSSKYIEDDWKTYRQERGVDKEQSDLADGYIQFICKVGTYTKTLFFKKSNHSLKHVNSFSFYSGHTI